MSTTATKADPFRPAARVAGQRQDVWYTFLQRVGIMSFALIRLGQVYRQ